MAINTLTVRSSPLKEAGTKCKPKNSPEKKNDNSLLTFLKFLIPIAKMWDISGTIYSRFLFLFLNYFVDFVKMLACGIKLKVLFESHVR